MEKVATRTRITDIRRWGPYSPLVIITLANELQLWAELSTPDATFTFTSWVRLILCVACIALFITCLCIGLTSSEKANEIEASEAKEPIAANAVIECDAADIQQASHKRLRRSGSTHERAIWSLTRNRFRGLD